jgi:hypothetical protein
MRITQALFLPGAARRAAAASALAVSLSAAGVTNPDLSALGQLHLGYHDDPASEDYQTPALALGETEIVLDAALNPYARGFFVLAFADGEAEVEEAYMTLHHGLPWGLGLKAGKYRLGFGKLNPLHPHAYPFVETPRVLAPDGAGILPGEEGFNEPALQLSWLMPTPGDWASLLSLDLLQGGSFHPDTTATALAWLARWSNSLLLGEVNALEAGLSATQGTHDLAEDGRTWVFGADLKTKLHFGPTENLTLQLEAVQKLFDRADSTAILRDQTRMGFYAMADFRFRAHYNAGALYEQYQTRDDEEMTDRAIKAFAGFALLEESTLLRVFYEHFLPDGGDAVNRLGAQLVFSMGPHKPHRF